MRFEEIDSFSDVEVGDIVRIKPKVAIDVYNFFGAIKATSVMIELFRVDRIILDSSFTLRIRLLNKYHPNLSRDLVYFKPEELYSLKAI